ncbi:hypothetical protein ACFL0V_02065 [Nanoarchaeota archaeon]
MADVKNIFKQVGDSLKQKEKDLAKGVKGAEAKAQAAVQAKMGKPGAKPVARPGVKPVAGAVAKPVVAAQPAGAKPTVVPPGMKKPFDINIYMIAVQNASNKFFKEQVPYFFKNIKPVMQKAGPWWKGLKQDQQMAYAGWAFGHVLMLVGIVLLIVL